jgi:alkylhydroperoxidase family enzyme
MLYCGAAATRKLDAACYLIGCGHIPSDDHNQGATAVERIRPLDPGEAGPEMDRLFEDLRRQRGNTPNMFRAMAYRPAIAQSAASHLAAVFEAGTVERRLKEMLAVRVSQVNDCHY